MPSAAMRRFRTHIDIVMYIRLPSFGLEMIGLEISVGSDQRIYAWLKALFNSYQSFIHKVCTINIFVFSDVFRQALENDESNILNQAPLKGNYQKFHIYVLNESVAKNHR